MSINVHHRSGEIKEYERSHTLNDVKRALHACLLPIGAVEDMAVAVERKLATSLVGYQNITDSALSGLTREILAGFNYDAALLFRIEQTLG